MISNIQEGQIKKSIKMIDINTLSLSEYNPRFNRDKDQIDRLAQRINRNGFEVTRALWVYQNGSGYKVFAGGTRLEAAKRAAIEKIPCVVYEGMSEADIVRLAYEDNENDEYHEPVSIVDIWAHYAKLAEQGWTQQRIADAVGVSQQMVGYRLKLNDLSNEIKDFTTQDLLTERHLRGIMELSPGLYFERWLTTEDLHLEVCKTAADKKMTARQTEEVVKKWKELLNRVNDFYESIEGEWKEKFVDLLTKYQARGEDILHIIDDISIEIAEEKKRLAEEAEHQASEAEKVAEEAKHRQEIEGLKQGDWWALGKHWLYCGDTSKAEFWNSLPEAAFAFADPPYNANAAEWDNDFNWEHDWLVDSAQIVAVTPGISSIFDFAYKTTMPYRWSLSTWIKNGMTRGAIGYGNWIYTAIFSKQDSIYRQKQDFFNITISTGQTGETNHKGRKPPSYMDEIIKIFTDRSDLVLDPFAGSGETLLACERLGRQCITGEINTEFCKHIIKRWESVTGKKAKAHDG